MAKDALRLTIAIPGVRGILTELSKLPKELQGEIRDAAQANADTEAKRIVGAATTKQEKLVASTVRSKRDRLPAIVGGGAKQLTTSGTTRTRSKKTGRLGKSKPRRVRAGDLFFGVEFGGQGRPTTQQFQPHKGTEGYFFYPTLRADEKQIAERWLDAVDRVTRQWDGGL